MYVFPACRFVAVQVPRAVYWKTPLPPPVELQPAMLPSPAPMSDETTATWMLGKPPGSAFSASMNIGKFVVRFACCRRIDDELSTMNSTSRLRFAMVALVRVVCGSTSSGAHAGNTVNNTRTPPRHERDRMAIRYARPPNFVVDRRHNDGVRRAATTSRPSRLCGATSR